MNKSSLWIRTGVILAITLLALFLVFGPRDSFTASDFSTDGIKKNLENNINLGLDLKGGSHLVMRVKVEEYLKKLTENNRDAAVNIAKQSQLPVGEGSIVAEKDKYSFTVPITDSARKDEVIDAIKKNNGDLGVNWTESSDANSVTWSLPIQIQRALGEQAVEQDLKIIESRINSFGVKEPTLQRQGAKESYQILLQMPGVEDPERVKALLKAESRLELAKVVSQPNPSPVQTYPTKEAALQSIGGKDTSTRKVLPYFERDEATTKPGEAKQPSSYVVIEYPSVVDGNELRDASASSRTGRESDYEIYFSLKPTGATKFGQWTTANKNNYMAVVLNEEVRSVAYIKDTISDSGQISGNFTKATADDLALTLKSGALPAPLEYQEERTVGPSLGADAIRAGVTASLGGLVFVIIFMLIYYRGSGVNAVVALILNMILTLAALVFFKSTLTLPGIAGLILGIGMAVDSNVLIFERIREELRAGKAVWDSVEAGFDRAFVTIIDTHITTILSSVILFMYGSGPIKGFAVTLILGLLINLFSAVFVSKTIFMWVLKPNSEKISI